MGFYKVLWGFGDLGDFEGSIPLQSLHTPLPSSKERGFYVANSQEEPR